MSAWGGIAGVQSTLAVLLECGYHERALPLERIASLLAADPRGASAFPARAPRWSGRRRLVLVDLAASFTLGAGQLQQRHKTSPYLGHRFAARAPDDPPRRNDLRRRPNHGLSGGRLVRPT